MILLLLIMRKLCVCEPFKWMVHFGKNLHCGQLFLNADARVPFTILGVEMEAVSAHCGGRSSYSK